MVRDKEAVLSWLTPLPYKELQQLAGQHSIKKNQKVFLAIVGLKWMRGGGGIESCFSIFEVN